MFLFKRKKYNAKPLSKLEAKQRESRGYERAEVFARDPDGDIYKQILNKEKISDAEVRKLAEKAAINGQPYIFNFTVGKLQNPTLQAEQILVEQTPEIERPGSFFSSLEAMNTGGSLAPCLSNFFPKAEQKPDCETLKIFSKTSQSQSLLFNHLEKCQAQRASIIVHSGNLYDEDASVLATKKT